MKKLLLFVFLTIILTLSTPAQTRLRVGSEAPIFAGTSMDGTPYDLNELRGSVVVVTFWSTKCEICHRELPKLNRFIERYDTNKVVFLALTMENEDKIAGYLKSNPFKFQILPNSFGVVLQYADRDKAGNIDMGFPSFFVIDQDGLVQYRSSGYDKTAPLDAAITKLMTR
ncbi:MAG: TlpA disulfide reductase family protein [Pyrinomonadaceae bacterium]